MATVDCDRDCRDDFDGFGGAFGDPTAVADSGYSDAAGPPTRAVVVNGSEESACIGSPRSVSSRA